MNLDNLAVDNLVVNDVEAKAPNYAEEEDGIYSYISEVSEEDRKQGRAAGNVLRFAFRGIQDGKYIISLVGDDGKTISDSECGNPCRVIKSDFDGSVTRREYTPDSMLGAAFEDALNGRLKVTPERQAPSAPGREASRVAPDAPQEDTSETDYEPPADNAPSTE